MSARGGAQSSGEETAAGRGARPAVRLRKPRHYARGADAERRIKRELEARGAFVVRAAGSHGCADLVALWPVAVSAIPSYRPWLLQIKRGTGRCSPEERAELIRTAKRLGAVAQIVQVVPRKPDRWEALT